MSNKHTQESTKLLLTIKDAAEEAVKFLPIALSEVTLNLKDALEAYAIFLEDVQKSKQHKLREKKELSKELRKSNSTIL